MWKSYLESNSNFLIAPTDNFPGPSHSGAAAGNAKFKFVSSGENKPSGASSSSRSNDFPALSAHFEFCDNLVSPCTPVLFSSSRGLQLRTRRTWRTFGAGNDPREHYNVQFCDLERWSTNRAHVLSISEDNEQMLPEAHSRTRSVGFGVERGSSKLSSASNH